MTDSRYPTVNQRDDRIFLSTWPGAKAVSIPRDRLLIPAPPEQQVDWPGVREFLRIAHLRPDQPCGHPGCLHHVTHPCEGCGRIAGRWPEETAPADEQTELPKRWVALSSGSFKEDET